MEPRDAKGFLLTVTRKLVSGIPRLADGAASVQLAPGYFVSICGRDMIRYKGLVLDAGEPVPFMVYAYEDSDEPEWLVVLSMASIMGGRGAAAGEG